MLDRHSSIPDKAMQPLLYNFQQRFARVRDFSGRLAQPLSAEDCGVQSMPDASPTRWHLAHTTWFFETFLLKQLPDYRPFDERFEYLFNSYYNAVGQQFPRERRGQISRPGFNETIDYRQHVDQHLIRWLASGDCTRSQLETVELGLQHEQQHQELILTDIKHALFGNPLFPSYHDHGQLDSATPATPSPNLATAGPGAEWWNAEGGVVEIGCPNDSGFSYDNEGPRHTALLQPHRLASRCVTNGDYLEFIQDAGYSRPELWLSLGWACVQQEGWQVPLYWIDRDGQWFQFTLAGLKVLDLQEPVSHVSYFEADAYARWSGHRLPTEFEWEAHSAERCDTIESGVFADRLLADDLPIHPRPETSDAVAMMGNVWQWTASPYAPYPGYKPVVGALGEYNGKFMCNQYVLRGGSCATSSDHIRRTYRNFFPPHSRWQFSGIRLASDS